MVGTAMSNMSPLFRIISLGYIIARTDATWGLLRGIKQRYRPICGLTSHPLLLLCVAVACCMKPVCVPVPSRVVTNRCNSSSVETSIISGSLN